MTLEFYDGLSSIYELVYEDWPRSVERQGAALEALIRERHPHAQEIADVACGIGTQCLGLAQRGFTVTASDIAPQAVERARREAASRGLTIDFRVDDMETLATYDSTSADVLIACDNAVPHLLSDEQILNAFRRFREVLRDGGLCIITVRDYATVTRGGIQMIPYGVRVRARDRVAVFQVWEWDGDQYDLGMYFVFEPRVIPSASEGSPASHDSGDPSTSLGMTPHTRVFRSRYYAVPISRLMELMTEAGFTGVERLDGVFFQPLLVGRK